MKTQKINDKKPYEVVTKEELRIEFSKVWNNDARMVDFCTRKVGTAIRLSGGQILTFDTPKIETSFCYGYSISQYDSKDYDEANKCVRHAKKSSEYLKSTNLYYFDRNIPDFKKEGACLFVTPEYSGKGQNALHTWYFVFPSPCTLDRLSGYGAQPLIRIDNPDDLEAIKWALATERMKFEKRLDTYIKRYGTTKVRSWSYWQDE